MVKLRAIAAEIFLKTFSVTSLSGMRSKTPIVCEQFVVARQRVISLISAISWITFETKI